ncbi:hypothetical protein ACF0H5_008793 [Mactra antiquata]
MVRQMAAEVRYKKMSKSRNEDEFLDIQFQRPPPKFPKKAIILAVALFVGGTILLVIGSLLMTGYIDAKYGDRTWPVLILGSLMFIPGFYHVRIAYYAYQGYVGYSFDDIPEFD